MNDAELESEFSDVVEVLGEFQGVEPPRGLKEAVMAQMNQAQMNQALMNQALQPPPEFQFAPLPPQSPPVKKVRPRQTRRIRRLILSDAASLDQARVDPQIPLANAFSVVGFGWGHGLTEIGLLPQLVNQDFHALSARSRIIRTLATLQHARKNVFLCVLGVAERFDSQSRCFDLRVTHIRARLLDARVSVIRALRYNNGHHQADSKGGCDPRQNNEKHPPP